MNKKEIENHLSCAMKQATPNVLDEILAGCHQQEQVQSAKRTVLKFSGFKMTSSILAACLVLFLCVGGMQFYNANYRISSVIELDVNPSIELSVTKAGKVLEAKAVNQDAVEILDDMELRGVEMKVAINAIIGSMVQHGYLDDLDSAILVTVSNDNAEKAEVVRKEVVSNIEECLKENKKEATIIEQKLEKNDNLSEIAAEYGISSSKANFIQKIAEKDPSLSIDDLALMSITDLANLIKTRGIDISDLTNYENVKDIVDSLEGQTANTITDSSETETEATSSTVDTTAGGTTQEAAVSTTTETTEVTEKTTAIPESSAPASSQDQITEGKKIKISDAYYKNGIIRVEFEGFVSWKNPTVAVSDNVGDTYPAMIVEYQEDYCDIYVDGITHSGEYEFTIAGIKVKNTENYTTVIGSLDIYLEQLIVLETTAPETTPSETTMPESTGTAETETSEAEGLGFKHFAAEISTKSAEGSIVVTSLENTTGDQWEIKFSKAVDWIAPVITVTDELGNTYVVSILEKNSKKCVLAIDALTAGHTYTIKISGIALRDTQKTTEVVTFLAIISN